MMEYVCETVNECCNNINRAVSIQDREEGEV